ncbi:MAG TPA: hypothetical protein VGH28_02715 [Polyangiaceae bacterium]
MMLRTLVFTLTLCGCAVGVGSLGEPSPDGGTSTPGSDTSSCDGWADPDTAAGCHACTAGSASCQSNGCYGGYWCDTSAMKCHATAPSGC